VAARSPFFRSNDWTYLHQKKQCSTIAFCADRPSYPEAPRPCVLKRRRVHRDATERHGWEPCIPKAFRVLCRWNLRRLPNCGKINPKTKLRVGSISWRKTSTGRALSGVQAALINALALILCSRQLGGGYGMNVIYTEHARQRMVKRRLAQEWIERVIANPARIEPDETDPELEHRLGRIPELADRVLRVIVAKSEPMRVITMHLDRNLKGLL